MNAFNFIQLTFMFAIIALFGNFKNGQHEISTNVFEQSFVRIKLRKPIKSNKKKLKPKIKIQEQKLEEANFSNRPEKV